MRGVLRATREPYRAPLRSVVLVVSCFSVLPPRAAAQQPITPSSVVRGRIIDDQSGAPLGNVLVNVSRGADTVGRVATDDAGYFRTAPLPAGYLVLSFRRLGYQSGSMLVDSLERRRTLAVAMTALPAQLDAVSVSADALHTRQTRLSGFDERAQRRAGGTYLQRLDLQKAQTARVSDMMRRVPGTRVVDNGGVLMVASSRGYKADLRRGDAMAPCVMRVGVDGQIKEAGFSINTIDPSDIYGIEIYNGPATMPPEFSGLRTDSFCGLIMIWTRVE
jgi:hypothetical protein